MPKKKHIYKWIILTNNLANKQINKYITRYNNDKELRTNLTPTWRR